MTSIVRHTAPAIVRNVSGRMPVISLQATLSPGLYVLAKTYHFPRGKDVCVLPEDFISMEIEIQRLEKSGDLLVIRRVASRAKSTNWYSDTDPLVSKNDHLQRTWEPREHCRSAGDPFFYLEQRVADPELTDVPPLEDGALWFIDRGTGNTPVLDIDVRVRLAGQTYSLFKSFFYGSFIDIPFDFADWLLSGDLYYLDIGHFLDSTRITEQVWEGDSRVYCHAETTLDPQHVRLYVTADPDMRFSGRCSVFKVT